MRFYLESRFFRIGESLPKIEAWLLSFRFTLMLPLNATFYGRKSALDNGEIKIREYNYQQDHKP